MKEIFRYEAYKKKLQGICDENDLIFRVYHDGYPITLTIGPDASVAQQTAIKGIPGVDERAADPGASIVFAYIDGSLTYRTSETFTIGDELFSKIKNLYKNMHSLWLQFFFRHVVKMVESGVIANLDLPNADDEENPDFESSPDEEE